MISIFFIPPLLWPYTLPSSDSLVQFQVMKTAIIIAIFLINVFMSKKYLINVNDKKEYQNGSDYSGAINFQIEDGQHTIFVVNKFAQLVQ